MGQKGHNRKRKGRRKKQVPRRRKKKHPKALPDKDPQGEKVVAITKMQLNADAAASRQTVAKLQELANSLQGFARNPPEAHEGVTRLQRDRNSWDEAVHALSTVRERFCSETADILIPKTVKPEWAFLPSFLQPKPSNNTKVRLFERIVWAQIHDLLPIILNALPFHNALAAIEFAQNMVLERLRVHPSMAVGEDIAETVREFLISVVDQLPVTQDEEEREEGEVEGPGGKLDEPKISDTEYNKARGRVGANDPAKRGFDAKVISLSERHSRERAELLAADLLLVPCVGKTVKDAASQKDRIDAIAERLKAARGNAPELQGVDKESAGAFLILLAANLSFENAVKMVRLLVHTPVTNGGVAFELQKVLRTKYKSIFQTHAVSPAPQKEKPKPPSGEAEDKSEEAEDKSEEAEDGKKGEKEVKKDFASVFVSVGWLDEKLVDEFRKGQNNKGDAIPLDHARAAKSKAAKTLIDKQAGERREAQASDKKDEKDLRDRKAAQLDRFVATLAGPKAVYANLAKIAGVAPPDLSNGQEDKRGLKGVQSAHYFFTALKAVEDKRSDEVIVAAFENFFAYRQLTPGSQKRKDIVKALEAANMLAYLSPEVLSHGGQTGSSIIDAAISGGWATKREIEVCKRLLGPVAFTRLLGSHMARRKQGPLRSIIEQTMMHRDVVAFSPPLTNGSLILDTNMIDVLLPAISSVPEDMRYRRAKLNELIIKHKITDIRLSNMNIAELGDYGRLIGRTIKIQVEERGVLKERPIKFLGVPFNQSRSGKRFKDLFQKLEETKVGESKGHADRSMMADTFLAKRKKGDVPVFASADLRILDKIGEEEGQLNLKTFGLAPIHLAAIETYEGQLAEMARDKSADATAAKQIGKSGEAEDADHRAEERQEQAPPKKLPGGDARGNSLFGFVIQGTHTVSAISRLITSQTHGTNKTPYQLYVVGGSVRDYIRRASIHDVDMKTNMPVDTLQRLLKNHGLEGKLTVQKEGQYLVKIGEDPAALDIVCNVLTQKEFDERTDKEKALDLKKDALERDFTLNALYLDASGSHQPARDEVIDPLKVGAQHAREGKLRYVMDRDGEKTSDDKSVVERLERFRAERIVLHLIQHPEEFGRALKFMERSHQEQQAKQAEKASKNSKKRRRALKSIGSFHLEAAVLDILRANATTILTPLVREYHHEGLSGPDKGDKIKKGENPAARKNYFLHKTGFKTPMELVNAMHRLHFPVEAIRMVIPDSVAGEFGVGGIAFNRNVSPRNRHTGSPKNWDPKRAPKVKVDLSDGKLYQHRIYACLKSEFDAWKSGKAEEPKTKILIDVDMTNHAVKGHPAPHFHIFRDIGGKWVKNKSGLSNTGQAGRPDVTLRDGYYVYNGPKPWEWIEEPKERLEGARFQDVLTKACEEAQIQLKISEDGQVTLGDQLEIPLARLQAIDAKDRIKAEDNKQRITRLLMLIRSLEKGHVEKDDDSLSYFTRSKKDGERLRFTSQLGMVDEFLKKDCRLDLSPEVLRGLSKDDRVRSYDLISAQYDPLVCHKAARYAQKRLNGPFDAPRFVDYFEFYMATITEEGAPADLVKFNKKIEAETKQKLWSDKPATFAADSEASNNELIEKLIENKGNLFFSSASSAAYHLVKHSEVTNKSLGALSGTYRPPSPKKKPQHRRHKKNTRRKKKPRRAKKVSVIPKVAKAYRTKARSSIKPGTLVKAVQETVSKRVLFFESGDLTTLVECSLVKKDPGEWKARILTCYGTEEEKDLLFVAPSASSFGISATGEPLKRPLKAKVDRLIKTRFGIIRIISTISNGDCFFDSVRKSGCLHDSVAELRARASGAIKPNSPADQEWLAGFLTGRGNILEQLQKLKQDVARPLFWEGDSGDIVPHLMAKALNRRIYIFSGRSGRLIEVCGTQGAPIYVVYNGQDHYEACEKVK